MRGGLAGGKGRYNGHLSIKKCAALLRIMLPDVCFSGLLRGRLSSRARKRCGVR